MKVIGNVFGQHSQWHMSRPGLFLGVIITKHINHVADYVTGIQKKLVHGLPGILGSIIAFIFSMASSAPYVTCTVHDFYGVNHCIQIQNKTPTGSTYCKEREG
jgi:hypothetical protein